MSKVNIEWTKMPIPRRRFLQGASALGLAAGAGAGFPISAWAEGSTLKSRTYADMRSLDPAFSQGVVDEEIHAPIYSKLIQYKPGREWGWQLDAAASVEQVDETHIKFSLRDDMGFTNGFGAMTAEDVKYSFERIIDDDLKSTNKPDWGPLDHVEVTGEREGVIVLKNAFQPLWSITLPYITGNIVSKKAFEEAGGKIETSAVAASGPYMHKSWEPKQKTTLVRNPDWKGEKAAFDEIQIFHIDDEKTAEIAFEAGELDFTRVSLASLDRLKSSPPEDSTVDEFPSLYYAWVGMNVENDKLKNKKLRQAIQHVIDVPSIMEAAYFGVAKPSTGIIAPGLAGHREASLVPAAQDLAKAQELLDESGAAGTKLAIDVLNKQANVTAAQIIQANLSQIGIELEVRLHEGATFWTLGDKSAGDQWKNVELLLNRFSMTPDPYYATAWFTCEQVGVWNWERICIDEFDKLHEAAQAEGDAGKRDAMYRRAQDLMEETGAYKFLTHEATPVIYRNSVKPALRPDGLPLLRYFAKA
ncbi:ABC transporter substrate-binding protein [Pelagibius sp. Alg239-R121]|uniref:ABC transporter substrate-binding protein n=1 Tax=Pelagibius sp. Alg239-R121 TaxID=2993448 RepID=UPI0024A6FB59|nr:ABC transporter substrate-binding protein [Pelagibius sp. Alg239-R121]